MTRAVALPSSRLTGQPANSTRPPDSQALRHLNQLPDKIREAALAAVFGPIAKNPRRLGKPLLGELEASTAARRGDYRIIYEIPEEEKIVVVHRIEHWRDVYRRR